MLKVSSFWRGFSRSAKLDSRYTSEEENSMGTLLPIVTTLLCDFDKYLHLKHSYTQMCRRVGIFQKSHNPIVMTLLAPGKVCHKSCVNPTFGDHRSSQREDNFNFTLWKITNSHSAHLPLKILLISYYC